MGVFEALEARTNDVETRLHGLEGDHAAKATLLLDTLEALKRAVEREEAEHAALSRRMQHVEETTDKVTAGEVAALSRRMHAAETASATLEASIARLEAAQGALADRYEEGRSKLWIALSEEGAARNRLEAETAALGAGLILRLEALEAWQRLPWWRRWWLSLRGKKP